MWDPEYLQIQEDDTKFRLLPSGTAPYRLIQGQKSGSGRFAY